MHLPRLTYLVCLGSVFKILARCHPQLCPQVIFALPPRGDTDYSMRIFNSDGSEPEMCGNGIRCLARFVAERDAAVANGEPVQQRIHTLAGA